MQIQEIITYIVVAVATGFVLFSLFKTLFPSKEKLKQHGCSGGCNCDAKVMRKELLSKKFGIIK
ncbi:MAG: FeoB-associated Cys-rich membrane protein [Bacteroidales bacterium]|nr:FeoB-associated Cys-rich membrane protein [Bacteroidales bacterium]